MPTEARITGFVEQAMADLGLVPGVAVAVARRDGTVWTRGFGHRDLERGLRVTPQTVFYTASLGKAFTGLTAAVLAAHGDLDLDSPLSRHFPALRLEPPLSADSVTVRDLLRHAKGFTNSGVNFVTTYVGPYPDADLLRVLARYSTPTNGEEFRYANTNYALAGYVISRTTDRAWQLIMDSLVFEPLGMHRSTAYLSRVPEAELAQPYMSHREGFERIRMLKTDRTITGAGGIFSTAEDLARFVIANLNDGRIDGRQALPQDAVREAHSAQIALSARFYEFDRHAYGLGFYQASYDGDLLVHHFGGLPGYRSHVSFMPARGLGVVVLQNEGTDGNRFADLVATYIYDLLLGKPDVEARSRRRIDELRNDARASREARAGWEQRLARLRATPAVPSLELPAYAGSYENERLGTLRIMVDGSALRVRFGDLTGMAIPAGGNDFLVDWLPGSAPPTFSFRVDGALVSGFDWGPRPFVRVSR